MDNDALSHDVPTASESKKKQKHGIFGVPQGDSPMLFSFTSKELWPDDKSDGDDADSDEDYQPELKKSPSTKRLKPLPETASTSNNTDVIGSLSTHINQSVRTIDDSSPISSSSFSSEPSTSSFDTKVKSGKRAYKPRTTKLKARAKTPKAKKSKSSRSSYPANQRVSTSSKSPKSPKSRKSASFSRGNNQTTHRSSSSFTDFNSLLRQIKFDFEQILPPEILVKIFDVVLELEQKHAQTLIKLSQVCDNWRNLIISTPILWQKLDFTGFADDKFPLLNFQRLNDEFELFSCVKELSLSGWSGANAEKIIEIVTISSNFDLELLNVRNCRNISCKFLDTVIRRCPNLKALDISAITYFFGHNIAFFDCMQSWSRHGRVAKMALKKNMPSTKKTSSHQNCQNPFTTPVFRPLLETCGAKMVSLKMSENMLPSFPTSISIIMEFCHNLEVLDVSNVASLGARSTSISVDKLQRSCPNLRVLRAANVNFKPTVCSAASPPVPGFPHLEELSIPFHESFMMTSSMLDGNTDWTLELLTKGSEKLTLLDIRGSRYISPRGLLKVPTWFMKHLSISNCTKLEELHETLGNVFTKWSKTLVDVDLSWNKSIKCIDACIGSLCEVEQEESQLKSIQLRGSAISHEMLRELLRCCPVLASIDLQSCRSLPRGIKRAFNDEEFVKLRTDFLEGKYD